MAEDSGKNSTKAVKAQARQERLEQSLRANLRRRKGQKKARDEGEDIAANQVKDPVQGRGSGLNPNDGVNEKDGS